MSIISAGGKNEHIITRGFLTWILITYTLLDLFSLFMVEKCDFRQVVNFPFPKNRLLINLSPLFSTYELFLEWGWIIPVSTFEEKYFNEKMSSLADFNKILFNFLQK